MPRPIVKRDAIERGLVEVVAEKGLAATSIHDIAARAGVSPGLLYRYWENRDALAAAVYRRHHGDIRDQVAERLTGVRGARAQLRAGVRAFYEFVDAEPVRLKFLLLSQHELSNEIPGDQRARSLLRAVYRAGVAEGVFRVAPEDSTLEIMLGMVLQPAIGLLAGVIPPPLVDQTDAVCDAIERAFERRGSEEPQIGAD